MITSGSNEAINEYADFPGSVETWLHPTDKYGIPNFARDDFGRFLSLVEYMNPRDAEIMLCYAVLQKSPTDLSILFGKAGHRAEEDLLKAAHKLAGLIEFGPLPSLDRLDELLHRQGLSNFGAYRLSSCLWRYAQSRDFAEMARLVGSKSLRQHLLRVFKKLHACDGREEGLLAGWILWLVDGANPDGKGWRKRRNSGRLYQIGPRVFHTFKTGPEEINLRRTGRGGRRQYTSTFKVRRQIKFVLKGAN